MNDTRNEHVEDFRIEMRGSQLRKSGNTKPAEKFSDVTGTSTTSHGTKNSYFPPPNVSSLASFQNCILKTERTT